MGGGGGSGGSGNEAWFKDGIMAVGMAGNPDYAKLAADSIAKEMAERGLVADAGSAPVPTAASTNNPPTEGK
jgi:hypothetical protein